MPGVAGLQKKLSKWGIGLHSAANGVWLSQGFNLGRVHGRYHQAYVKWLTGLFIGVNSRAAALAKLRYIRNVLRAGRTPWIR